MAGVGIANGYVPYPVVMYTGQLRQSGHLNPNRRLGLSDIGYGAYPNSNSLAWPVPIVLYCIAVALDTSRWLGSCQATYSRTQDFPRSPALCYSIAVDGGASSNGYLNYASIMHVSLQWRGYINEDTMEIGASSSE